MHLRGEIGDTLSNIAQGQGRVAGRSWLPGSGKSQLVLALPYRCLLGLPGIAACPIGSPQALKRSPLRPPFPLMNEMLH
jgi:hypothetical protein